MIFTNDQSAGISVGFQLTVIEVDCSYNCNCTGIPSPNPNPATISGFVALTTCLVTITAILVVTRKIKVKKL